MMIGTWAEDNRRYFDHLESPQAVTQQYKQHKFCRFSGM
jgi:hypothetical protein